MSYSRSMTPALVLWVATALCLSASLIFFTPRGLGMSPDSVAYLKSAQGYLQGRGFDYFSVQWPPLYPLIIGLAARFIEGDFYLSSRLINAVLFGCVFLLLGILWKVFASKFDKWMYVFAGLLALHPVITHTYFYALSEALFLPIILLDLIALCALAHAREGARARLIVLLSIIGFIATLTRYAGLCVIALNIFALLIIKTDNDERFKWLGIVAQTIPALLFLGWWRQRLGVGDTEANLRPLIFHPPTLTDINLGLSNIGQWLLGSSADGAYPTLALLSWLVGLCIVCTLFVVSTTGIVRIFLFGSGTLVSNNKSWLVFLASIFVTVYLIFLLLMRSFFDPNIVFDYRTLSPALMPLFVVGFGFLFSIKVNSVRRILLVLLTILLAAQLQQVRPLLLLSYFNGLELTNKTRLNSELVKLVRTCPKDLLLHADYPWNFNLEMTSMVRWLPATVLYGSGTQNTRYPQQVSALSDSADLIIVENLTSDIVSRIDGLGKFSRIYQSSLGIVWQNNSLYNAQCLMQSND